MSDLPLNPIRQAAGWLCFAVAGYHYQGLILTAIAALCTYWVLWKRNPDSPFALVAWPVWYLTGFLAVAALLRGAIYLDLWGLCTALPLIDFWVLPLHRQTYARWEDLYNRGLRELADRAYEAAGATAEAAHAASLRIRWRGQEARAASALLLADTRLKLGHAAHAERLASQAIPEFERSRQILGITPDAAYRIRGLARLETGDIPGAAADLRTAARLRLAWAGADTELARILQAEAIALSRAGQPESAAQRLSQALTIAQNAGDKDLESLIRGES